MDGNSFIASFLNRKGGVGKTSSVFHLAGCLRHGRSQGSASATLTRKRRLARASSAQPTWSRYPKQCHRGRALR